MASTTHEDFLKSVAKSNPNITVLGEYINRKTKILVKDELGIEYLVYPESVLRGALPKISSAVDQNLAFKTKLKNISPDLKVESDYKGANEKIIVSDSLGIKYSITPGSLLTGNNPSIKIAIDQTEALKKMVYAMREDLEILSEYNGDRGKILVKDKDEILYEMVPYNLLKGNSLTLKAAKDKTDYVRKKIAKIHPDIKIVSEYKKPQTPLEYVDELDIRYKATYSSLLHMSNPRNILSAIDKIDALTKMLSEIRSDIVKFTSKYTKALAPLKFIARDGFEHQMNMYGLLEGNSLGFNSVLDSNKYFDYLYSQQTKTSYKRKSEYKGYETYMTMECQEHGDFNSTPQSILNGIQCPECSKIARTNTIDDFVKRAVKIHGSFYDYSNSEYKGFNSRIVISCPFHGEFEQSVKGHLSGKGCRKCADEQLSGVLSNLARDKPDTKYLFYYLILWNDDKTEIFGKKGLTLDIKQRFWGLPYNYKVVEVIEGPIKELYKMEQKFFEQIRSEGKTYRPKKKFKGHTECFKLDEKEKLLLTQGAKYMR